MALRNKILEYSLIQQQFDFQILWSNVFLHIKLKELVDLLSKFRKLKIRI